MADAKITALTENTAPLGTDIMPMVDDPGGTPLTQKITITNLMTKAPMLIPAGASNWNPTDGSAYYIGAWHGSPAGTSGASRRLYIPRAGTITAIDIYITCTTGSSETSTVYIRKNDTTDTSVSTAIALNASPYHELVTGLSISVAAGDYIELKWVTPTWSTNPTAVYWYSHIVLS